MSKKLKDIKTLAEQKAYDVVCINDESDRELYIDAFTDGAKAMINKACEYAEARYDLDYCGNVRDVLDYLKSLVE